MDNEVDFRVETPEAELDQEYRNCESCTLPYRVRIDTDGNEIRCSCPYCGCVPGEYELYAIQPEVKGSTLVFHVQSFRKRS